MEAGVITDMRAASPLGATVHPNGVNFSLFSRSATDVALLLFDREEDARPSRTIRIDPAANRTYHYWHVFVPGIQAGQLYAYRVSGPLDPANGLRCDPAKVLLDPFGRGVVVPKGYSRAAATTPGDNAATAMKRPGSSGHLLCQGSYHASVKPSRCIDAIGSRRPERSASRA